MSKEVKRYELRIVDRYAGDGTGDIETDARMKQEAKGRYVLFSDYDTLLAERDALKAEQALWEPIHYEIHRRAEKQWCLSSQCDFEVTVTYEDYAAIDAALQGAQP